MSRSSQLLISGEALNGQLLNLLDCLRGQLKLGYLSVFQHHMQLRPLHRQPTCPEVESLLEECVVHFEALVELVKSDEDFHGLYRNADFTINAFMIMNDALKRINVDEGVAAAVTVVQNIQNELSVYLSDFSTYLDNQTEKSP